MCLFVRPSRGSLLEPFLTRPDHFLHVWIHCVRTISWCLAARANEPTQDITPGPIYLLSSRVCVSERLMSQTAHRGRRQRPESVPQLNPETEYIHHKAVDQVCHMLSCRLAKQGQPCAVETASALRPENKGQAEKCPDFIPPSLLAPTLFVAAEKPKEK